jgi:hypothetical protein
MQCGGAVYARVPADGGVTRLGEAIGKARAPGPAQRGPLGVLAHTPGQSDFALVDRWGKSDDMPRWAEGPDLSKTEELVALSREVGEVIAYYDVDDGDGMLVYGHWRDGALVRSLLRLEGEGWDVTGTPEPWEAGLFTADALERAAQEVSDDGGDEAAVRAAFAGGHISAGARWPRPPIITAMMKALRLPSWGFQPWPRRREEVTRLSQG